MSALDWLDTIQDNEERHQDDYDNYLNMPMVQYAVYKHDGSRQLIIHSKEYRKCTMHWIFDFETSQTKRVSSRYVDVIEAKPTMAVHQFLKVRAKFAYAQHQMKLYQAHTITITQPTYAHNGDYEIVANDCFVEADDKYEVAFEMAKRYLIDMRQAIADVRIKMNLN